MTGTVSTIVEPKGYGFIADDDGGPDVFFHQRVWRDSLYEFGPLLMGMRVEFHTETHNGRIRATRVQRADR